MKKVISFFAGTLIGITAISIASAATGQVISVARNSCKLQVDNKPVNTDHFSYNGKLYISLSDVEKSMGCIVENNKNKNEVRIFNEHYSKIIPTPEEDFVYKGVKIKMTPKQVQQVLGKPLKILKGKEDYVAKYSYVYSSCTIGFGDYKGIGDVVWSIQIVDKNYKTKKGIGFGNSKIRLIRKYGKPRWGDVENNYSDICYESNKDVNNGMQFDFDEDGKINSITIYMAGMG